MCQPRLRALFLVSAALCGSFAFGQKKAAGAAAAPKVAAAKTAPASAAKTAAAKSSAKKTTAKTKTAAARAYSSDVAVLPAGMNPDAIGFGFYHTCGKNDLLDVRIVPGSDSQQGMVYVYNRLSEVKPVTVKGASGKDSVVGTSISWHSYAYGSVFDPLVYLSELGRLYPGASEDCLKYLVSRISGELLVRNTSAANKVAADPPASAAGGGAAAGGAGGAGGGAAAAGATDGASDAGAKTAGGAANAGGGAAASSGGTGAASGATAPAGGSGSKAGGADPKAGTAAGDSDPKAAGAAAGDSGTKSTDTATIVMNRNVWIIPSGAITMIPDYRSTDTTKDTTYRTIAVKLKLTGNYDSADSHRVTFQLLDTNALANRLAIKNPTQVISKADWDSAITRDKGVYTARLFLRKVSLKDSIKNVQRNYIVLQGDTANPNHSQEIVLRANDPNKPFWVELGANFDLLNGLQSNNLYGAVILYKRDVARIGKDKDNNLSLFGGVYEAKTVSSDQSLNFANFQYVGNSAYVPQGGTPAKNYYVYQDTGTVAKTTTVNNLGLFISPQLRLTNGSANSDGLHVFLSVWIEAVWQRTATTFDYSKTAFVDSFQIIPDSAQYYRYKPGTLQGDYRSQFYGVGMPIYLKEHNTNLFLNSVIGISNQVGLRAIYKNTSANLDEFFSGVKTTSSGSLPWKPFYLFQFRLNEEKYGISFTGEVRGVIAPFYKPFITLALSKKFDLSKLLEFK